MLSAVGPRLPGSRREAEGNGGGILIDFHMGAETEHIIDGALYQTDGAGNGGADDVFALFSIAAVAFGVKTCDALTFRVECNGCHQALILVISTLV